MLMMAVMAASSCSSFNNPEDTDIFGSFTSMYPTITGLVTDESGKGIEHIKVTLDWKELNISNVIYTSSDGEFNAQGYYSTSGPTTLVLTLEDVDDADNGGPYATVTETIILFEGEIPPSNYHIDYIKVMTPSYLSIASGSSR